MADLLAALQASLDDAERARRERTTDQFELPNPTQSLFAPETLADITSRLDLALATDCDCLESTHENALHDLAHDDVPVLITAVVTERNRVHALQARIDATRALHVVDPDGEWFCSETDCNCREYDEPHQGPICGHCSYQGLVDDPDYPTIQQWPCATVRALDGGA